MLELFRFKLLSWLGPVLKNVFVDPLVIKPLIFKHFGVDTILASNLELDRKLRVVPHLLHLPFTIP